MDPPNLKKKRLYQVWKGRNKFFCGGRLIFGPDGASVILSIFLIGAPALAFCINMLLRLHKMDFLYGILVFILGLILTVLDLAFLFATSARDPGIVPRNTRPPDSDSTSSSTVSEEWINGAPPDLKLPKTKDVFVNGHAVKVKFCDTCLLYRPPRASHCSICNNCVQRFDHHCPWVGQCIGARNYRTFFSFISTSTVLCIYVFTFSLLELLREPYNLWKAMSKDIISVVLTVYCFIVVWFVGGLTIFHLYLICTNQVRFRFMFHLYLIYLIMRDNTECYKNQQTTYENFRYRYDKKANPYSVGISKNLKEILFSKTVPSLLNFRDWAAPEDYEDSSVAGSMHRTFGSNILKMDGKPVVPSVAQSLNLRIDEYSKEKSGKVVDLDLFLFEHQHGSDEGNKTVFERTSSQVV